MPGVTFITVDGHATTVDVPAGWSVVEAALQHGISEIIAECGGNLACATCHVSVAPEWLARLPAPASAERDLLQCTAEPATVASRLACQIVLSDALDGLTLHLPASQS